MVVLPSSDRSAAICMSAGAQYSPQTNILSPTYWQMVNYRMGARYSELPKTGNAEYAVSCGFGLPIGHGKGVCDLGVELGKRSATAYSRIR